MLDELVAEGDLVITMGAGTIGALPGSLVSRSSAINAEQLIGSSRNT